MVRPPRSFTQKAVWKLPRVDDLRSGQSRAGVPGRRDVLLAVVGVDRLPDTVPGLPGRSAAARTVATSSSTSP